MPASGNKLTHMSRGDYESLGETLLVAMHSYLPGEQQMLSYISGKILDVFYDEFVKFIPPFILKREQERRRQLEEDRAAGVKEVQKKGKGNEGAANYKN